MKRATGDIELQLQLLRWVQVEGGAAIAAGDVVYQSSPGVYQKARADAQMDVAGVAVEAIGSGGTGFVAYGGFVTNDDWTLTPGATYFLSAVTAGAIVDTPDSDTAGHAAIQIGRAVDSTTLWLNIQPGIIL